MKTAPSRAASEAQIRHALPESGRGVWRDPSFPALELVGNNRRASWYYRPTIDGKRVREKLGVWPATSCPDAREAARVWAASAASSRAAGVNVIARREEKRREAKAREEMITLREVITGKDKNGSSIQGSYWHSHLKALRTGEARRRELLRFFGPFLDRKPCDIKADAIKRHIEAEARRIPGQTGVMIRAARPIWAWMAGRGWCENLLADVKPPKDRKRERDLALAELAKIWIATEGENGICGALVRLMILTAQRRGEVGGLRLGEIDFEDRVWTLPPERTKTASRYTVPLTDDAIFEIRSACAISGAVAPDDYVFRTGHPLRAKPDGPFDGFSRLQTRIRDRANLLEHWQFHDFRAAFVGRCADNGVDPAIADRCLNHAASGTSSGIAAIYMRSQLSAPRREAFELWAQLIRSAVVSAKDGNEISIGVK